MSIEIPELSLVVLVGPSGAGKSTFAAKHFLPTEVVSSDVCRALVSDDATSQAATADAFDVLHYIAGKRLSRGLLTVVDATNVQRSSRASLVSLARDHDVLPVAVVLNLPPKLCEARNEGRPDRKAGPHVVRRHSSELRKSLRGLKREGFRRVFVLSSVEDVDAASIVRVPLWNDRRDDAGPFDIVGDVHGCLAELESLLEQLGYARDEVAGFRHPDGRRALFVGDLVDRGPDSPGVLQLVMTMVAAQTAIAVLGNHDAKLLKKLDGRQVRLSHGLAETMAQLEQRDEAFISRCRAFLRGLVAHLVFDDGRLVVAHAGLPERMHGRASGRVRQFCLYGETTGEVDAFGLPVRHDWARDYRGRATVVYGHTPTVEPTWVNNTMCIDTGCVFGGSLSALRYPERELVSVAAEREYYEPVRPLEAQSATTDRPEGVLRIDDVAGKQVVDTRVARSVTVRAENAAAALEVMSRFSVDPRWLIYLPPTMSPPQASSRPDFLEHPEEAFAYFAKQGVDEVICQEKHMGSRVVVVVCRDEERAAARFGVTDGKAGVVYTRTGRPFFNDDSLEAQLIERVRRAADAIGLWADLASDWVCLDAELMPWSAKAQELLHRQYAPVAASSRMALSSAVDALRACDNPDALPLLAHFEGRQRHTAAYARAYRPYCWSVASVEDLALAPFHVMASESGVHVDRDHAWHLAVGAALSEFEPVLRATRSVAVSIADEASVASAVAWWEELTNAGGEGMVVKPKRWLNRGPRGLVQPAIKCRGSEYLRIIYGPEYLEPARLERLRSRKLNPKRRLASNEFALGLEGLHRFVEHEPLYRVHECAFAVLALESEPVDPRL